MSEFLESQKFNLLVWYCYIDDIFFIWTHGDEKSLIQKFKILDPVVNLSNNKLAPGLFINATDRRQHLHYTSSHPEYTKRSIVYSQALRISHICSQKKDFVKHSCKMISWFLNRGYP